MSSGEDLKPLIESPGRKKLYSSVPVGTRICGRLVGGQERLLSPHTALITIIYLKSV